MEYIKLFDTTAQYNAYTADTTNFILPNVSVAKDAPTTVHYNPLSPTPPTPTYESVDLGLPSGTLWAKWNVGATSETEYGNYYQYGKGADDYSVTSGQSDYSGTENPLATSADTVAQVWGGSWHMPTQAQFYELTANTNYTWTTIDGVNGGKFANKTDATKYVFFPAAGRWSDGSQYYVGSRGYYWSSTPNDSGYAYNLYFRNGNDGVNYCGRDYGCSVRGVLG